MVGSSFWIPDRDHEIRCLRGGQTEDIPEVSLGHEDQVGGDELRFGGDLALNGKRSGKPVVSPEGDDVSPIDHPASRNPVPDDDFSPGGASFRGTMSV